MRSAEAAQAGRGNDDRVVVVVRMLGGNDGLNTVVPFRDDRYFGARPTIAIAKQNAISMAGGDLGLNPWLSDVNALIDNGHASIVQGVGYTKSSRSHTRSTEIWETGSVADEPPAEGWLGRYIDHTCECATGSMAGVQFGTERGRTLASKSGRSGLIGNTQILLDMNPDTLMFSDTKGPGSKSFDHLRQAEQALGEASLRLRRAASGSGNTFEYPDTPFGQSLRWTGNMIETGSPMRVYYVTIGSFDTPEAASFDTHIDQPAKHRTLFSELGRGLRSFASHMQKARRLDRVLLLTFSDFGRQLSENRTSGTDHGDASVLFVIGGGVRPGLLGQAADLGTVHDGGLDASVDFRQVYADVLQNWLRVDPAAILGEQIDPFPIIARA